MKLADLTSIWEPDLSRLSGRDRGQVYFQRCQLVLGEALRSRRAVVTNNRIDREWLRSEIGCALSVLNQNTRIREHIEDRDRLFAGLSVKPPQKRRMLRSVGRTSSFITKVRSARFTGRIRHTDLVYDNNRYTVPVILWNGWIDIEASAWLRNLAVSVKAPIRSLKTYASVIRDFTRFRRRHEVLCDEVDDALIQKFQSFKLAKGIKPDTINNYTDIIFGFYVWLEETGRVKDHVQLNAGDNFGKKKVDFKITSKHSKASDRKANDAPGRLWNHRLTPKNRKKSRRKTPNKEEIGRIHDAVLDQKHGERNALLFLWAEKTGARRFEVLQITLQDLPTVEERDRIADIGGTWAIEVFRKGGGHEKAELYAPVDLLRLTAQYVKYERSKIVENCAAVGRPVSDGLFLTDKGTTLAESSLTGLSRAAFIKAGVLRASYHRLRAVFATNETKKAVEALESGQIQIVPGTNWTQTILIRVAELLDHSNLENLEHYLTDFLNARIQRAQSQSGMTLTDEIDGKRRELAALDRRIANRTKLMGILDNIAPDADNSVRSQLYEVAREILRLDE